MLEIKAAVDVLMTAVRKYVQPALQTLEARADQVDARVKTTNESTSALLADLDARVAALEAKR